MEVFLEIVKIIIPVSIVCLTFYFLIREFFNNETEKRKHEHKRDVEKTLIPLKLQAYERATLFLERIAVENIVLRVHQSGMSAKLFHSELSKTIRLEYEHNLAQQIYLLETSWELIKNAKEETLKIFNLASSKMEPTSTGIDLSHFIFEIASQMEKIPTLIALEYIKKEVNKIF